MGQRHGPVTAILAVALTVLLTGGPAAARMPLEVVPRSVPSQSRPDLVVVVVPTAPAAEETAAVLDESLREAVVASGRFDLARLIDLLDAENAKEREGRVKAGDAALEAAQQLYNDLDTIRALSEADRAIRAYAETDLTQHMDELVGAWIFKIASLVANGENKAAELEMEKLLAVAPKAQFSPNYFPPEQIATAEKWRKAIAAASETMEVTTVPAGAEVFVDGVFRGVSPVKVRGLAAGDHFVSARAPGYSLAQQRARTGQVELTLQKSESWPKYEALVRRVKKDPRGPQRDLAAKEFAAWARVQQVLLAIVDVAPGAKQAKVTALRLEAKDGHNAAWVQRDVPSGEGVQAQADALASALLGRDEPRRGGPVTHFGGALMEKKLTGYVLLGTGAALLVSGVAFGVAAGSKSAEFRELRQTDALATSTASTGRTYAAVADVSYLAGLIAAGAGAYLAFWDDSPASRPSASAHEDVVAPAPPKEDVKKPEALPAPATTEQDEAAAAANARAKAKTDAARLKKQKEEEAKKKKRQAEEDDLRNY